MKAIQVKAQLGKKSWMLRMAVFTMQSQMNFLDFHLWTKIWQRRQKTRRFLSINHLFNLSNYPKFLGAFCKDCIPHEPNGTVLSMAVMPLYLTWINPSQSGGQTCRLRCKFLPRMFGGYITVGTCHCFPCQVRKNNIWKRK